MVCAEFESRLRLGNSLSRSVAQQVEQVRNAREMVDGKASRCGSDQIATGESGRYGGLSTIRKSASQSAESKPHPSLNKQHHAGMQIFNRGLGSQRKGVLRSLISFSF